MKQPKRLTYEQKKKLAKKKINPEEYMLIRETETEYILYHKETKVTRIVEKQTKKS